MARVLRNRQIDGASNQGIRREQPYAAATCPALQLERIERRCKHSQPIDFGPTQRDMLCHLCALCRLRRPPEPAPSGFPPLARNGWPYPVRLIALRHIEHTQQLRAIAVDIPQNLRPPLLPALLRVEGRGHSVNQ